MPCHGIFSFRPDRKGQNDSLFMKNDARLNGTIRSGNSASGVRIQDENADVSKSRPGTAWRDTRPVKPIFLISAISVYWVTGSYTRQHGILALAP